MNMHGFLSPPEAPGVDDESTAVGRLRTRLMAFRPLFLVVFLPTLLLALYYYGIASDQYESEAHFIVNAKDSSSPSTSAMGSLLGIGTSGSQSQMLSVPDYLKSHDAVADLGKQVDLPAVFRRPGVDWMSRLWREHPAPETLLKYYRSKVIVQVDHDTGITDVRVRTFRPDDSYHILTRLLDLSEARINQMNERSYNDALAMARKQLAKAESNVTSVQSQITAYRRNRRDVDPKITGQSRIQTVAGLTSSLATARAQLETMGSTLRHDSPQYVAAARQVSSLEQQIAGLNAGLTVGASNIASNLGGYEDLQIRQEFAAKRYDAAAASLQKAQEDAMRQQLYLVRVVDANVPVKSEYPQRGKIILTAFLGLLVAYGIGWLIIAGVREHAA